MTKEFLKIRKVLRREEIKMEKGQPNEYFEILKKYSQVRKIISCNGH